MTKKWLFIWLIWLAAGYGNALQAQYDLRRLTELYRTALELRATTEKAMGDAIVLSKEIQPYRAVQHLDEDTRQLQELIDELRANTPKEMTDLVKWAEKLGRLSVVWLMDLKSPEPGPVHARIVAKGYKQMSEWEEKYIETLKKYLGMDEETLAALDHMMTFYTDAQRGFISYLLRDDPLRHIYASAMELKGDGSGLFERALTKVRKLMNRYSAYPELRKSLKNMYADLMFFSEAIQRGYEPQIFYISFEKFDDKYRRFLELFFQKNKWI